MLVILHLRSSCVGAFILLHLLKGRAFHLMIPASLRIGHNAGGTPDVGNVAHRCFRRQTAGDLHRGALSHAVHQQIGGRVKQNRPAHPVVPVVIVGKSPQRRLQSADNDGCVGKGLPGPVGIYDGGPVRPEAQLAAGAVQVLRPPPLGHRIVGHHGIQIAAADEHAVPGFSHGAKAFRVMPVRLGQHRHAVPLPLQQPGNNGAAEAGVIDIAVCRHHQKIIVVPTPVDHLVPAHRQKFRSLYHTISRGS